VTATKKTGGLAAALRSKIGRTCWFTHPETGAVLQGVYKRGRKVAVLTAMTRMKENVDGGRGFNLEETVYTVPRSVKITFGQAPAVAKP
jgi:hypothetical protein